jgi:outer membrane protein OmpA-like peptidoglycan-associated protein
MRSARFNRNTWRSRSSSSRSKLTPHERRPSSSSEKNARAAADQRAQDALSKIEGLQSKPTDKGLVLTLSGSVLFASGKSDLLPAAKKRLGEVAAAIKADGRSIRVLGHTDSQGADDKNLALSQKRADAVKAYLAESGVPNDRIRTEGMGEAEPIASNDTTEGRANNRRVEIILENKEQQKGGQPQQ